MKYVSGVAKIQKEWILPAKDIKTSSIEVVMENRLQITDLDRYQGN